jgi:hypothetical protein
MSWSGEPLAAASARTRTEQATFVRRSDGRSAVADIELGVDVEEVRLDRRLRDEQSGRGTAIGLTLGD